MKLPNTLYDWMKWIGLIALPALGLAYSQLATTWNLPYGPQIQDTCDILGVLIGTLIGISAYTISQEQKKEEENQKQMEELIGEPDGKD